MCTGGRCDVGSNRTIVDRGLGWSGRSDVADCLIFFLPIVNAPRVRLTLMADFGVEIDSDGTRYEVKGLPSEVLPGEFGFTYPYSVDGTVTLLDVKVTWQEGRFWATWWHDISDDMPGLSVGSSSPYEGWISWISRDHLTIAYQSSENGTDGYGDATYNSDNDAEYTADFWLFAARAITTAVWGNSISKYSQ